MPGIKGLRSELSAPWNRQQADSLAQVFIEAGPRFEPAIALAIRSCGEGL